MFISLTREEAPPHSAMYRFTTPVRAILDPTRRLAERRYSEVMRAHAEGATDVRKDYLQHFAQQALAIGEELMA
jgi:hypothetical protein